MRLRRVSITRFKNLHEFTADFSSDSPVSVIVGRNGTGKSNLLEALTIIFRDLDLGIIPNLDFTLEYECRGREIRLSASTRPKRLDVKVDGVKRPRSWLSGANSGERLLPDFVFGYYSGPSNRLASHYLQHQEAFSRALREGNDIPLRRLFYAQPIHSQFVLLAFFLSAEPDVVLKDFLRIGDFDSALFVLKEPYWAQRRAVSNAGNARFWGARGTVSGLLDALWELALAPMRTLAEPSRPTSRRERRSELLYLYLKEKSDLVRLARERYGGSPQELFKAFESILSADLLDEVRVRVRMLDNQGSLVFRELSEGEQQLLMVLGLLRFTTEDESLFLLDEPDTHLNPAWSLEYVKMLEEGAGASSSSSQLLMATHDPLVISGLLKEQVILLERRNGATRARHPRDDPQGQGVAGLLTSEIYGLASDLDPTTLEKLERHRLLAARENLSSDEESELGTLAEQLGDLGFTFTTRDPLYTTFEKAMLARPEKLEPTLSAEEQEKKAMRARVILDEIFEGDPG
ncbi:AAA family ATPase [Cryocola sp. 340MFSha3.1]|uniref:AAA family ATPase n=1 Tax=Cryocola sp. 340MFSha3.1 TaxID=1169145 RepID=UPI0003A0E3A7|nr:AAA family ATPase [Cryocola sp. 340MFSha3.1]